MKQFSVFKEVLVFVVVKILQKNGTNRVSINRESDLF